MREALRSAERTVTRCLVCGSSEVRTDEVVDRGFLLLAECSRCDHRWTEEAPDDAARTRSVRSVRPALRVVREVASAA
jgi:hypothetical protein